MANFTDIQRLDPPCAPGINQLGCDTIYLSWIVCWLSLVPKSGWPKSSLFLSKNKRHSFHFHQELYWTTCSPLCSTVFCHFSGNFIIPSSPSFLSFRTVPGALYSLPGNWNFFPLREFCKDQKRWMKEGRTQPSFPVKL